LPTAAASACEAFELLSPALQPTSVREDAPQSFFAAHELGLEQVLEMKPPGYSDRVVIFFMAHTDKSMKSNTNDESKIKTPHNANSASPDV
jgi:hypothetical protein